MPSAPGAGRTRRQELIALLERCEWSFEDLRREMQAPVRELEDDLRHVERSLRRGERRLVTTPPRCSACGFSFGDRAPARFATPGHCPRCRSRRIRAARLRVG